MFFYGTRDDLISSEHVQANFKVSAEPKVIHELKTEHDYRYHKDIIEEVNDVVEEFINEY